MSRRERSFECDPFDPSTDGDHDVWSPTTELELSSDDPNALDGLELVEEPEDCDDIDRERTRRRARPFDADN